VPSSKVNADPARAWSTHNCNCICLHTFARTSEHTKHDSRNDDDDDDDDDDTSWTSGTTSGAAARDRTGLLPPTVVLRGADGERR